MYSCISLWLLPTPHSQMLINVEVNTTKKVALVKSNATGTSGPSFFFFHLAFANTCVRNFSVRVIRKPSLPLWYLQIGFRNVSLMANSPWYRTARKSRPARHHLRLCRKVQPRQRARSYYSLTSNRVHLLTLWLTSPTRCHGSALFNPHPLLSPAKSTTTKAPESKKPGSALVDKCNNKVENMVLWV